MKFYHVKDDVLSQSICFSFRGCISFIIRHNFPRILPRPRLFSAFPESASAVARTPSVQVPTFTQNSCTTFSNLCFSCGALFEVRSWFLEIFGTEGSLRTSPHWGCFCTHPPQSSTGKVAGCQEESIFRNLNLVKNLSKKSLKIWSINNASLHEDRCYFFSKAQPFYAFSFF